MNRIMKKLVPGVLAAALALGAVPSGITVDDIKASADDDLKVVALGGSVGTQIYAKLIFHVPTTDTKVAAIRVKDPDDDTYITYNKQNSDGTPGWEAYIGTGAVDGDYIVQIPVFPKNMHKDIKFEMLDENGEPVLFFVGGTDQGAYSFTVNKYLTAVQDTIDNDRTGDARDIKDNATNVDKALWDLCNALMNYGDWARAFFYYKDQPDQQPDDGRYSDYSIDSGFSDDVAGKHPYYPTWWTNKVEDSTQESGFRPYWKSDVGVTDFNEVMTKTNSLCTISYQNGLVDRTKLDDDDVSAYSVFHPYKVSLVLDDYVRLRVRSSGSPNATAKIKIGNESATGNDARVLKQVTGGSAHWNQKTYSLCVDSEPLRLDQLSLDHIFEISNVCPKTYTTTGNPYYNSYDKISVNVLGYARIIHDMRKSTKLHEHSGLANTVRALVTVSAAEYNYQYAHD